MVPLADACVTEWRIPQRWKNSEKIKVPLADACVTEWRKPGSKILVTRDGCHSLMLVLLNGGQVRVMTVPLTVCATR